MVITHDINLVKLLGDLSRTRILAIQRGQIAFDVMADEPTLPERLRELYGVEMRAYGESTDRVIVAKGSQE
jgi:ABC-type hemin transport system ATPase subunit